MANRGCPNCGHGGQGHHGRTMGRGLVRHGKSNWKTWLVIAVIVIFWAQSRDDGGTGSSRTPDDPKPQHTQSQCDPGALFCLGGN